MLGAAAHIWSNAPAGPDWTHRMARGLLRRWPFDDGPRLFPRLRRQLDVLQMRIKARDTPWEHILRDHPGIHGSFREEPEQRHFRELVELVVPDLPQESGPLARVQHPP